MKTMMICVALLLVGLANPTFSQDRKTLGWGQMFTNDVIGDAEDRWRTGSYVLSHVRGPTWTGTVPRQFGDLIEYRFRGEVIAPERLNAPSPADRRYVGALSFGAHSHWRHGTTEMSLGLDLVFVGPQTKLDGFQLELHDLFGGPRPDVSNFQVENAVFPTIIFEAARSFDVGRARSLRPFVEVQAGAETLVRLGADLTLGQFGTGGLRLRDGPTGQPYLGITGQLNTAGSVLVGGDIAYLVDSRYLATPGIKAKDIRGRLRVGYHHGWKRGAIFYGVTYLTEEFEAQREGQVLGSLDLRFRF